MAPNMHRAASGGVVGSPSGTGGRWLRAFITGILVFLLPLSACGSTTPTAEGSASVAVESSSPSATPEWDLVLMGDSVLLQPGSTIEARLEQELGVNLQLRDWINPDLSKYSQGGERSADLVERLRTDENLRQDLRDAEIIVFDVPTGIVNDVCTGDPSTATPETSASCFDEAVTLYKPDVEAVFEELVALRDPSEAMIRVTDVWQFLYPTFTAAGVYDAVRPRWQEMNQAVHEAAAQYGIPVVPAYAEFTGPVGDRDPVASGDVQDDELHLTSQGVEGFVDLLVSLGFAPVG